MKEAASLEDSLVRPSRRLNWVAYLALALACLAMVLAWMPSPFDDPSLYEVLIAAVSPIVVSCGALALAKWGTVRALYTGYGLRPARAARLVAIVSFLINIVFLAAFLSFLLLVAGK